MYNSFTELNNDLKDLFKNLFNDEDKATIGKFFIGRILTRVSSGRGVDSLGNEHTLKPLSNATMLLRKIRSSKCTLTDSGRMLSDISYSVDKEGLTILFKSSSSSEKAERHESGTSRMPARPFFNVSKTDLKDVQRLLNSMAEDYINRRF